MSLEALLTLAFQRGCGISRTYALRSARYRELLASAPRVPNTTQAETAEMLYLGERLADRAFRNLPAFLRQQALAWPTLDPTAQHAVLEQIMRLLNPQEWKRLHHTDAHPPKSISDALPAEYGSWSRGPVPPNCLGMSQMLIGFARATGAEHLMVDTITQHDHYQDQIFEMICRKMIELLTPYREDRNIARLISKIETHHMGCLETMGRVADAYQAHHALAIKVADKWILVDPYLRTKYVIAPLSKAKADPFATLHANPRQRWVGQGGFNAPRDGLIALYALEEMLGFFARRDEPVRNLALGEILATATGILGWHKIPASVKEVPQERLNSVWSTTMHMGLLTQREARLMNARKKWQRPSPETLRQRSRRAKTRKRDRNLVIIRLIQYISQIAIATPYDALHSGHSEHRRIEMAHPALHLATMTLNHLGGSTNNSTADLIRFDTSQWIIHDTLREVVFTGNKRLHRIATGALRKLKPVRPFAMPQLLIELDKRK